MKIILHICIQNENGDMNLEIFYSRYSSQEVK